MDKMGLWIDPYCQFSLMGTQVGYFDISGKDVSKICWSKNVSYTYYIESSWLLEEVKEEEEEEEREDE